MDLESSTATAIGSSHVIKGVSVDNDEGIRIYSLVSSVLLETPEQVEDLIKILKSLSCDFNNYKNLQELCNELWRQEL